MKKTITFFISLSLTYFVCNGQNREATFDAPAINEDIIGFNQEELNIYNEKVLQQIDSFKNNKGIVYQIPIVFHVLTDNASDVSNISDCIIQNQVTVLNNYFRKKSGTHGWNTNAIGTDAEIEFLLPCKDPNGNPTNGIDRQITVNCNYTTLDNASQIATIKGVSTWPTNKYLNIWVLKTMPNSNKVRAETWWGNNTTTGIFIHYSYVGSKESGCLNISYIDITGYAAYDLGTTLVHEIGHYLNLLHTFVNCSPGDYCDDTPAISGLPNAYCGTNNQTVGLCSGVTLRMFENYMDYSDDVCMNIFTANQVTRMRSYITSTSNYTNLVSSANINLVTCPASVSSEENETINIYPNPTKGTLSIEKHSSFSKAEINLFNTNYQKVFSRKYSGISNDQKIDLDMSLLPKGMYFLQIINDKQTITSKLIFE